MVLLSGARIVPDDKILFYLLDPAHPIGGAKARYFAAFGFTRERADLLVTAILQHADLHPVHGERRHLRGVNRVVQGALMSPDGRNPDIAVIWFQAMGDDAHRLVTAYPAQN